MGSDRDFMEMVAFVETHQIQPVVDSVFDIDNTEAALRKMDSGAQFGKIVLKIS
jgi:D-arabinose 1-dehydrogenase-like Zn-dependent alcohol dehydrogenase